MRKPLHPTEAATARWIERGRHTPQQLSVYDNAKHWVAQYEAVDDVKEFIDKSAAVEEYARRANDREMEIKAAKARVRAERRCGELLREMEKAKGVRMNGTKDGTGSTSVVERDDRRDVPTLADMNITKDQSSKFQKLANVPEQPIL